MHSPHARAHRSLAALTVACCIVVAAGAASSCADDSARVGAPDLPRPARTVAPAAPVAPDDAHAPEPASFDVAGRVVDDLEGAIVGRPVTVVDGRGKRQELLTDEDGGFSALGVVPPYDVLVEEAPSGAVITPLVFLGLRRRDPRIEVFERQGSPTRPAAQPLRIGVKLPACRATEGSCWVSVVSSSPSGGGGTAGSYVDGTENAVYELEHAWREVTTRPAETIDVHVLVGDAEYTQYAYARLTHVLVHPGDPSDLGVVVPMPVDSTEPVSVAGHTSGLPEGWQWTLASQLELPGGAAVALRYDWSAASSMRLPNLPGASWRVGAWAQHPLTPERPYFHRSSQAWSGTLPLTTANVALDVPLAPEPLRPAMEGTLSRRARGLAWDGHTASLASVVLVDLARGKQRFRAFTAEPEIVLHRLEALGLARLEPGEHVLDLTTTPGASVDALTEPDEHQRPSRSDVRVPGATTYQRFRFVVTQ
jgi:hypothetical protein